MPGGKKEADHLSRSMLRRRSVLTGDRAVSYFRVQDVPQNLTEEEYNKRLAEIKKLAGFG